MRSVPSRRRLPSTERTMWRRERPRAFGSAAIGKPDLRRDHQLVALTGHQPAQDLLRPAADVDVRAVEEVDAGVAAAPEHRGGRGLVGLAAERHGAEAQARHLHARAAESAIIHVNHLPFCYSATHMPPRGGCGSQETPGPVMLSGWAGQFPLWQDISEASRARELLGSGSTAQRPLRRCTRKACRRAGPKGISIRNLNRLAVFCPLPGDRFVI